MTQIEKTAWVVGEASKKYNKPIFCSFMGGESVLYGEGILNKYKIPSFSFPEEAITAIAAMWRYHLQRDRLMINGRADADKEVSRPSDGNTSKEYMEVRLTSVPRPAQQEIIKQAMANNQAALANLDADAIIKSAGIPTPPTAQPKALEEAHAACTMTASSD